tara:strand:+ start:1311 stop:1946 length:636 start_codon:yes stop_codon:yes gene_type:complete
MKGVKQEPFGIVLAGGKSRRFGTSKTLAEVGGLPMATRAVAVLKRAGLSVGVISSEDGLNEVLGVEVRADVEPEKGPVGGLLTALEWSKQIRRSGVFLLGCDMPLMSAKVVRALLSMRGDHSAVIPISIRGAEPLCGFYDSSCYPKVREVLDSQDRSMHSLLRLLKVREVPPIGGSEGLWTDQVFFNVNTREEIFVAERMLAQQKSIEVGE